MHNILIISAADTKGGAALHAKDIMLQLISQGFQVRMLVGYKYSAFEEVQELKRTFLKKVSFKRRGLDLYLRALRAFIVSSDVGLFHGKSILSHPWYQEADVVHLHNIHNYFFNLEILPIISREKKVVWTLHDMWSFTGHCAFSRDCVGWLTGCGSCPDKWTYPPVLFDRTRAVLRQKSLIYDASDFTVVVPSHWLGQCVAQSILYNKSIRHIPYGINTTFFKRRGSKKDIRTELSLPQDKKIVCFCANQGLKNKQKGGDYVLELVKRHPEYLFLLIGGNDKDIIRNVINIPYVSDPSVMSSFYNAADVLLIPSVAENYPFVVLEAMSCGLPAVGFDCGGITEQISHKERGYLASFQNVDDLDSGLRYILSCKSEQYNRLSKAAVIFGSSHTLHKNATAYLRLFDSL